MKKFNQDTPHPNDVPVIFLYNENGEIKQKISINEWRELKADSQKIEVFEIKLYREALNYYSLEEYDKACDLLLFLIYQTDYTHYEYVERLANIYRIQKAFIAEKELLLKARAVIKNLAFSDGLTARIDKRLNKVDTLVLQSNVAYTN